MKCPIAISFIAATEFCERFAFYGMKTVLVIYLRDKLDYSPDEATIIFHVFIMFVYFFPIFGAMIADSGLGRFKTIIAVAIIYALGTALVAVGSIPILFKFARSITLAALFVISLGSGGIKPCISAFGGDQFKLPEQTKQLSVFFSVFYFSVNAGSLISTFVTPIMRMDVKCFGQPDCYPLAFGVPAVFCALAILAFVSGKKLYVIKRSSGNMALKVSKCITHAVMRRMKLKNTEPREHWLDYASDTYGYDLVSDIKALFRILILYLPLPVFWALFDQQGSRWTFQATRMDGRVGNFILKPDQMQMANPLMVLVFIPLFDMIIYPVLAKCKISGPFQKLTIGGCLAAISFLISGFIELKLQRTYPLQPHKDNAQLRIFNGMNCDLQLRFIDSGSEFPLRSLGMYEDKHIAVQKQIFKNVEIEPKQTEDIPEGSCLNGTIVERLRIDEGKANSFFISPSGVRYYEDDVDKTTSGYPAVRILLSSPASDGKRFRSTVELRDHSSGEVKLTSNTSSIKLDIIAPASYDVLVNNEIVLLDQRLDLGGVFTLLVGATAENRHKARFVDVVRTNSMHMIWLLPQYVVITMGEVMFSITGMQFSFSQAPDSMKSVLQAFWLLTIAFGNVIVIIVAKSRWIQRQSTEFFLFSALMFADMGIFIIFATRYKFMMDPQPESSRQQEENT